MILMPNESKDTIDEHLLDTEYMLEIFIFIMYITHSLQPLRFVLLPPFIDE